MSGKTESAAKSSSDETNDEMVRDYLKNHSDFLQRNPDMLDYLHISHASGSAISLVEKQVSVLRERNIEMRRRLNSLTANARDNDKLYEQTRSLVLKLLDATSTEEIYTAFDTLRILNRPPGVIITDKCGAAGIKHWIEHHGGPVVSKDDPRLAEVLRQVAEAYEHGRTTSISDDEMQTWYKAAFAQ